MRILGVKGYNVSFGRKPVKSEELDLKCTINQAYDLMGSKERAVITHGSCFPPYGRDAYIGSPYGNAAKEYIKFLQLYGFNSNQLGPGGELQKGSVSPYSSSAFAQNRLFIDLSELKTEKYGMILSDKTYNKITFLPKHTGRNYTMTDFAKAEISYNTALKESFDNFRVNLSKNQLQTVLLNEEYQNFLNKHDKRLTEEGVFKVLSCKYGTDDYTNWPDKRDISLMTDLKAGDTTAQMKFIEIYNNNSHEIEQYKFEQFLITKQIKEHKAWRDEHNFKYISDLLVGCSRMDAWRYEDVFLKDWEMGAYERNGISQRWQIPVVDPRKIFSGNNHELGPGGKFLREKLDSALEFTENIRIDHAMGLIEPYLLAKHAKDEDFITNPPDAKNKDYEKYISEMKDTQNPDLEYDLNWDYPNLTEYVVLPALREHGIDKDTPVWEDHCSWPLRFKAVYSKLDLPHLINIDWTRAEKALSNKNWFIIGSHDQQPVMTYLQRKMTLSNGNEFAYTRNQDSWNSEYLAGYLNMDDSRENIRQVRSALVDLYNKDDREIVMAKFVELLTTTKFQISFDDLLGITDVIYNVPGKNKNPNWKARITADYIDKYYENLSSDNPTALNIPELLHKALQAKIDMEVKAHNYDDDFKREIYEKSQPVLDKLSHYAEVLKEA